MQKFMVVSVKCRQLQGGFAPLTRGVAPGPHWGHSPQTPVVALRFGSTFPSGPPLQISCAPLLYCFNLLLRKLVSNCIGLHSSQ